MKSISPIIATILLIVIAIAIFLILYAFTSGMFSSLTLPSNNLVNQQSKVISFTISNVYCSNNIVYFDIYNNGNIPIDINNSIIIFTDNNGNTISINGSNVICNNGNIIPIGSNSLCYIINAFCYYNYTNYIKSMNFVFNGINYNYEILNNKFNLIFATNYSQPLNTTSYSTSNTSACYSLSGWLYYRPILINNTQNPNNLTNYPILVTLNTQTLIQQGEMRPDCGDIRFTDSNGTLLNYWIVPNTCNTTNTSIWVNVPFIPGGSTETIYLWYGNPNATSMSNGYSVFTFFEDFQNGTTGWTPVLTWAPSGGSASAVWVQSPYGYAGGISLSQGGGEYAATAALEKNISIPTNSMSYCFSAYAMWNATYTTKLNYNNYNNSAIIIAATNGSTTETVAYRLIIGGSPCGNYWIAFSGTCGNIDYLCTPPNTWININTNLTNDFLSLCNFVIQNITQISLDVGIFSGVINGYATDIIIRKCVSPESSVVVGPQYNSSIFCQST